MVKDLLKTLFIHRFGDRGSEIIEQVFWIGLVILAVLLLLPQLRAVLQSNMQDLINSLGA